MSHIALLVPCKSCGVLQNSCNLMRDMILIMCKSGSLLLTRTVHVKLLNTEIAVLNLSD